MTAAVVSTLATCVTRLQLFLAGGFGAGGCLLLAIGLNMPG
jgi:hypothetical protein